MQVRHLHWLCRKRKLIETHRCELGMRRVLFTCCHCAASSRKAPSRKNGVDDERSGLASPSDLEQPTLSDMRAAFRAGAPSGHHRRGQRHAVASLFRVVPEAVDATGRYAGARTAAAANESWGVQEVIIAVNHLRHLIEAYFGDGSAIGLRLRYSNEEKPLGTAGALGNMLDVLDETFFLANGDLLTTMDLRRMAVPTFPSAPTLPSASKSGRTRLISA